jgi:glycosyltransferase involved in cell wall biosynthesis
VSRSDLRHVGLNALFLQPRMGGLETYVRQLVPALLEARPELRISLFVGGAGRALVEAEPWAGGVELVTHPLLGRRFTRALTEATAIGTIAAGRRIDVLHSVALVAPLRSPVTSVVTMADVTWLLEPKSVGYAHMLLWRFLAIPAARRAERVITLSEAARHEIVEHVGVPNDRIDVVPLAANGRTPVDPTPEADLRTRFALGEGPLVLSLSALSVHKNLLSLIEALPAIREQAPTAMLVLPGNPTAHGDELSARAAALGVGDVVRLPGWIDDRDREGFYNAAACFVFPSRREGFGLPVLEAMRRGVPVACSAASALPEVAGGAALYFDPSRPEEIANAVKRILGDRALAADLAARGRERESRFSWRRSAELTLRSYERAVGSRSRR